MIINLLINFVLLVFGSLFVFLPEVTISSIPLIGANIYSALSTMMLTWNAFMVTFPYAESAWNILLFVILPFEFTLMVAKFFLGHRLPAHNTN